MHLEHVSLALIAEFLGNQLCNRQPWKFVIVIMGYAISVKVIKMVWDDDTSIYFNNTGRGAMKNRCPSASSVLNCQTGMSLNRWLKVN